jgi:hypothetical protein
VSFVRPGALLFAQVFLVSGKVSWRLYLSFSANPLAGTSRAHAKKKKPRAPILLATATRTVAAPGTMKVGITLSRKARKLIRQNPHGKLVLRTALTDAAGQTHTTADPLHPRGRGRLH